MIFFFRNFYFEKKSDEILKNNKVINKFISRALSQKNLLQIRHWIETSAKMNQGQAWLVNKEGVLTLSYPPHPRINRKVKFAHYQEILNGKTITQRVRTRYFKEPMLLVGLPVSAKGSNYGLLIFTPVSGIKETVKQVMKLMFYSSLLAIILAIFVAYNWSKALSNPLQKMSKFAVELGQGNFGKTINMKTDNQIKEINNLEENINEMSETLEDTINNLVEEKNKLDHILTGMQEGVLAVNQDHDIILINDSAIDIINAPKQSLIGKKVEEVITTQEIIDIFNNVFQKKEVVKEELTLTVNQSQVRILLHLTPIYLNNDRFWGVVALFQDISERWRFEQLQQEFLTNVTHDLKTPLSSIRGATELLLDDILDNPQKKDEYLKMIFDESRRLENLVEEILNLDHLNPGQDSMSKEKIEINNLLNNIGVIFEKIINSKKRQLKIKVPEDKLFVLANPEKLKQVLLNLLDNAHKFSPEENNIELKASKAGQQVKVYVRDYGIGIPEEELTNIWERFYKVDKARTPKKDGSGLGLAIVKQLVEAQGGEVFVESDINQGTIIGFYLDLIK